MTNARKPNFMVIGAQKCGTSFLCAALARHPSVFHSNPKEPLFFQRKDVTAGSFDAYLEKYFARATDQPAVGEGSTVYFQWPNAMENINRFLGGDIRIFICLRQPTDRAVSFYLHNLRKGRISGTERISEVGKDIRMSPVLSSKYASHLERWLELYGSNVRILYFDDLLSSPAGFIKQATDFLDIGPLAQIKNSAVNTGYGLVWRNGCLTLDAADDPQHAVPSFTIQELEDLHASFLDDIDRTQELLGKPLDKWKLMPEFTARQAGW